MAFFSPLLHIFYSGVAPSLYNLSLVPSLTLASVSSFTLSICLSHHLPFLIPSFLSSPVSLPGTPSQCPVPLLYFCHFSIPAAASASHFHPDAEWLMPSIDSGPSLLTTHGGTSRWTQRGMPLPHKRRGGLVNKSYPTHVWGKRRLLGAPWWGAWIDTLECSLRLSRDGPAGHPLCGCGAHYARQPQCWRPSEAAGLVAEIKKRGGIPRLPLIRSTCRPAEPPTSLPSYPITPHDADTNILFITSVISASVSLDFHSWALGCTLCLLMRNPGYEAEALF